MRPRRRLRQLQSVRLKLGRGQPFSPDAACFFALWTHIKAAESDEQEAACIYISKKIALSRNNEWAPLELQQKGLSPEHLHGLASGTVHLHVYTVPVENNLDEELRDVGQWKHPSAASLEASAQPPKLSPLHDSAGSQQSLDTDNDSSHTSSSDFAEDKKSGSHRKGQRNRENNTVSAKTPEQDAAHFVGSPQKSKARSEPTAYQLSCLGPAESLLAGNEKAEDTSLCQMVDLPGHLLLSVSLDLELLDDIGTELRALDSVEVPVQLIFEMVDSTFLAWPELPNRYKPQEAREDRARQDLGAADQVTDGRKRWSLFKRSAYGSANDLTENDAEAPVSIESVRTASLASIASNSSSLLRSTLSSDATADRAGNSAEAPLSELMTSMTQLAQQQESLQSAHSSTAQILRKLSHALTKRDGLKKRRQVLNDLKTENSDAQQRVEALRKRSRGVHASSKAARELMQKQTASLMTACRRLEDLHVHLKGPADAYWQVSHANWKQLHRKLVARRCRLVSEVQQVYDIQPKTVSVVEAPESGFLWTQLEDGWAKVSLTSPREPPKPVAAQLATESAKEPGSVSEAEGSVSGESGSEISQALTELSIAGSHTREIARLAIGSLTLEPYLARQSSDTLPVLGQQSNKDKEIKLAAALGYAAHVTYNLGKYLGVPLKYPIQPANSHSVIVSTPNPVVSAPYGRDILASNEDVAPTLMPKQFVLHPEGSEQSHCSYAIFLLNKDIEQLLESHGLTSAGPSLVLQNLYKLLTAALSAVVPRQQGS